MESEKVKEIKKALECCKQNEIESTCKYCSNCPISDWDYEKDCNVELFQKALDLINELEKENKNKTNAITELLKKQEFYEKNKLKQFAEILRRKAIRRQEFIGELSIDDVEYVKVKDIDETLKEFL